jgi:hypothetical protein
MGLDMQANHTDGASERKTEMKTAVFARNIPLESPIVTNTHNYALQFRASGWETFWLPKPATPWNAHLLKPAVPEKYGVRQQCLSFLFNFGGKRVNSFKLLWELFPYFLLSPRRRALREAGLLRPEVFFAGSLETASLYKLLKPRIFIYNAHDAFSLYPDAPASLRSVEAEVVNRATLTVTTAETTRQLLISQYRVSPDRIINLGHGVNNSAYSGVAEPERLKSIPHPRVVTLGTLDMQDTELIVQTVCALPEASFVFIGPGGDGLQARLHQVGAANCHFIGPVFQDELPSYLSFCDVGLIAYDSRLKENRRYGTNPMKRYDYAAAGLQTVSVDLNEYRKSPSPIYVAQSVQEFILATRCAVSSPRYSRDEIRAFARANDWGFKYQALIRHLSALKPGWPS